MFYNAFTMLNFIIGLHMFQILYNSLQVLQGFRAKPLLQFQFVLLIDLSISNNGLYKSTVLRFNRRFVVDLRIIFTHTLDQVWLELEPLIDKYESKN